VIDLLEDFMCDCDPGGKARCEAVLEDAYRILGDVTASKFLTAAVQWLEFEHRANIARIVTDQWSLVVIRAVPGHRCSDRRRRPDCCRSHPMRPGRTRHRACRPSSQPRDGAVTAAERAARRWLTTPLGEQRRMRETDEVTFHRMPDGTLLVVIGERDYVAPVPMARPLLWSHKAKRIYSATASEIRPGHPSRITCALDRIAVDGPEVDEALGVKEPTVDEWEAGTRKPTADDLLRLVTLTHLPLSWFINPEPVPGIERGWICADNGCTQLP
jgi:DNA-binding transcriptional regulator YiaG